jgi:hypothetical protein
MRGLSLNYVQVVVDVLCSLAFERMNRTPLDECFRVTGRTAWHLEPAEIQRDMDRFLAYNNLERSHQGYRLKGRTPARALCEALGIEELPPFVPAEEATEPAA